MIKRAFDVRFYGPTSTKGFRWRVQAVGEPAKFYPCNYELTNYWDILRVSRMYAAERGFSARPDEVFSLGDGRYCAAFTGRGRNEEDFLFYPSSVRDLYRAAWKVAGPDLELAVQRGEVDYVDFYLARFGDRQSIDRIVSRFGVPRELFERGEARLIAAPLGGER